MVQFGRMAERLPGQYGRHTLARAGSGRGGLHEAHISAQQRPAFPQARFPPPHEHSGWASHSEVAARQGPVPPVGVIGRLHGRSVFASLRERGVRVRAGWLWCSMVIDPAAQRPHVGYAIGRNVGPAVDRNRLRRRLRAALAPWEADLRPGWYLVGVSPRSVQPDWADVCSAVAQLVAAVNARVARS